MKSAEMISLEQEFEKYYGAVPFAFFQAPGRVNLMGEHTDYNQGFVLPCNIDYKTLIAISPREDKVVRVLATDYANQIDEFTISEDIEPCSEQLWCNYVRGVVKHISLNGFLINGANIAISGNIPQGAGLSSSASLEVAICNAFNDIYKLKISNKDIALISQEAENKFVGCNCGIMDQMVIACGEKDRAMMLDCANLEISMVNISSQIAIMIVDSKVKRGLVDSEYNLRREQCEQAASLLKVSSLRYASLEALSKHKHQMPELIYRRARHVITENERTLKAAHALAANDYQHISKLMFDSFLSMRNDFEITVEPINFIVEILSSVIGLRGGVRPTGGGFGGCVVALLPPSLIEEAKSTLTQLYENKFGLKAEIYVCSAQNGTSNVVTST